MSTRQVCLTINGREYTGAVEPRKLLTDFLRDDLGLTGTHVGCEQGVCGACTVLHAGNSAHRGSLIKGDTASERRADSRMAQR